MEKIYNLYSLKKLCDHKILINENATVRALINKDAYYANQSVVFVDETFNGSLPKFIAAFFSGKKLNKSQAETLKNLLTTTRRTEYEISIYDHP